MTIFLLTRKFQLALPYFNGIAIFSRLYDEQLDLNWTVLGLIRDSVSKKMKNSSPSKIELNFSDS